MCIRDSYKAVFPSADDRFGPLKIGQQLLGASDWYEQQWNRVDEIEEIPTLLIWGMMDSFIGPEYLNQWENRMKNTSTLKLNCGHFPQEEAADEVSEAIKNF